MSHSEKRSSLRSRRDFLKDIGCVTAGLTVAQLFWLTGCRPQTATPAPPETLPPPSTLEPIASATLIPSPTPEPTATAEPTSEFSSVKEKEFFGVLEALRQYASFYRSRPLMRDLVDRTLARDLHEFLFSDYKFGVQLQLDGTTTVHARTGINGGIPLTHAGWGAEYAVYCSVYEDLQRLRQIALELEVGSEAERKSAFAFMSNSLRLQNAKEVKMSWFAAQTFNELKAVLPPAKTLDPLFEVGPPNIIRLVKAQAGLVDPNLSWYSNTWIEIVAQAWGVSDASDIKEQVRKSFQYKAEVGSQNSI